MKKKLPLVAGSVVVIAGMLLLWKCVFPFLGSVLKSFFSILGKFF